MSWGWNDIRDNEKEVDYGVQGTVTISTQEYRDLLNRITELKIAGQKEHDDWDAMWKEREKYKEEANKLKEEKEKLEKEIKIFKTWLAKDDAMALQFFNYKENYKEETE